MMDTDFPAITPGKQFLLSFFPQVPMTRKPEGYFREELEGSRSYAQTGTDIPDFGIGQQYGQREGGPIFGETVVAGNPSFDILDRDIPALGPETPAYMRRKQLEMLIPGFSERARNAVPNAIRKANQLRGV